MTDHVTRRHAENASKRRAREAARAAEDAHLWDTYLGPQWPADDDAPDDYMGGAYAGYQSW